MITKTLMIFGPGGIGKSPVDSIVRGDAARVDPHRLRPSGPRDRKEPEDEKDMFYAHFKLRNELWMTLSALDEYCQQISTRPMVEWFPSARVAIFDVRGEWQCLLLAGLSAQYAKAEIYGPAVPILFRRPDVRSVFGAITIAILNPVDTLVSLPADYATLKAATAENCKLRGDSAESIHERRDSIKHEAPAWRAMLDMGATEYSNWKFPEHAFKHDPCGTRLDAHAALVERNPAIEEFLKTKNEIAEEFAKTGT